MIIPSSDQEAIPYINTDINTGLSTCIVTMYMYSYVIRILCVQSLQLLQDDDTSDDAHKPTPYMNLPIMSMPNSAAVSNMNDDGHQGNSDTIVSTHNS